MSRSVAGSSADVASSRSNIAGSPRDCLISPVFEVDADAVLEDVEVPEETPDFLKTTAERALDLIKDAAAGQTIEFKLDLTVSLTQVCKLAFSVDYLDDGVMAKGEITNTTTAPAFTHAISILNINIVGLANVVLNFEGKVEGKFSDTKHEFDAMPRFSQLFGSNDDFGRAEVDEMEAELEGDVVVRFSVIVPGIGPIPVRDKELVELNTDFGLQKRDIPEIFYSFEHRLQ